MLTARLNHALDELREQQGLAVPPPDEGGTSAFELSHGGQSFDVYLHALEELNMVSLLCPLGPPPSAKSAAETAATMLLSANTLGAQTNGLSFSLSPVDQQVCLGYSLLGDGVTGAALAEVLGRLLVAAKAWREQLAAVA